MNNMKLRTIIVMSLLIAICGVISINAQTTVKGDGNAGELNSLELDVLANQLMDTNANMRVIARLGDGETESSLNQNRLQAARNYLIVMRGIDKEKVTFTEGESVKGEGRLEFYLDDKLMLVSLAERGKNVRIGCCADDEDEIPPETETKKTDKPMKAETLAALIVELKEVVSNNSPDKNEAKLVSVKWDARKDLAGKTKSEVIELLYEDVKAVIKDSGTQYQIYSIFSFSKNIPDEFLLPKPKVALSKMPKDSKVEAEIIALEKQAWQAWKNKNTNFFQNFLVNDALSVNADGVSDKAQIIEYYRSCNVKSFSLSDFKFRMLDKNSALIAFAATQDAVCSGIPNPATVRVSSVYVKRDGKWLNSFYSEVEAAQAENGSVETQIIALEKASWEAYKNKDFSWFQANLAEDYSFVNNNGIANKSQLEGILADCKVKSFSLDDFKFVMLTKDSVRLTYKSTQDSVCNGSPVPKTANISIVYVNRNGKWLSSLHMQSQISQ